MTVELAAELLIDAEAATPCVRAVLVGMLREGGPSTLRSAVRNETFDLWRRRRSTLQYPRDGNTSGVARASAGPKTGETRSPPALPAGGVSSFAWSAPSGCCGGPD